MFSDYTDEGGVFHSRQEQEIAYQAVQNDISAASIRLERDKLLSETDWMALSDVTMSAEMAAYRQALRDITAQEGFPYNVTWPEKP